MRLLHPARRLDPRHHRRQQLFPRHPAPVLRQPPAPPSAPPTRYDPPPPHHPTRTRAPPSRSPAPRSAPTASSPSPTHSRLPALPPLPAPPPQPHRPRRVPAPQEPAPHAVQHHRAFACPTTPAARNVLVPQPRDPRRQPLRVRPLHHPRHPPFPHARLTRPLRTCGVRSSAARSATSSRCSRSATRSTIVPRSAQDRSPASRIA